jgi:hypothetical protein
VTGQCGRADVRRQHAHDDDPPPAATSGLASMTVHTHIPTPRTFR